MAINKISVISRDMDKGKFYCPVCGERLIPHPRTRLIKRGDPDYKKYRYVGRGRRLIGDIELTEYDFICLSCDKLTPYEKQCVIREIQKIVGYNILSEEKIAENTQQAKTNLEKKRKTKAIVNKAIAGILLAFVLYLWFRSGHFSFRIFL